MEEEAQATEEPERPLKRLRRRYQNGQTSSSGIPRTPLVKPKEEPDELSETHRVKLNGPQGIAESPQHNGQKTMTKPQAVTCQSLGRSKGKQPISSKSLVPHERGDPSQPSSISSSQQSTRLRTESRTPSHPMRLRDRVTGAASLQIPSKEKRPVPESSSHAVPLKEPKVESDTLLSPENKNTASHALIKPKDEPITDDMPCLEVPGVIFRTGMPFLFWLLTVRMSTHSVLLLILI